MAWQLTGQMQNIPIFCSLDDRIPRSELDELKSYTIVHSSSSKKKHLLLPANKNDYEECIWKDTPTPGRNSVLARLYMIMAKKKSGYCTLD